MKKLLFLSILVVAGCAVRSPGPAVKTNSSKGLELSEALTLGPAEAIAHLREQTQLPGFSEFQLKDPAEKIPEVFRTDVVSQTSSEKIQRQKFLRQFKSWSLGRKTYRGQQIMAEFTCDKALEAQALGLSLELDYPQTQAQFISENLHEKVLQCSQISNNESLFRLSVFSIQKGDCTKAETYLKVIPANSEAGVLDRASFLRSLCSKDGNFVSHNPWGGYGILVNKSKLLPESQGANAQWRLSAFSGVEEWDRLLVTFMNLSDKGQVEKIRYLSSKMNYEKFRSLPSSFQASMLVIMSFHGADLQVFQILNRYLIDHPHMYTPSLAGLLFPIRYWKEIVEYSRMEDPILVKALIRQESAFNPTVRSRAKAAGLMQLIYPTAHSFGLRQKQDLYKPKANIEAGSKFLSYLIHEFGSVELALAAYNAGPEMVRQWRKRYPTTNIDLFVEMIPYSETREYVRLVTRNYKVYQSLLVSPQNLSDSR